MTISSSLAERFEPVPSRMDLQNFMAESHEAPLTRSLIIRLVQSVDLTECRGTSKPLLIEAKT